MSKESPLQIIADPRFQMILTRAMHRGRVVPTSPQPMIQSVRSSWSSASAVSTIDLKSPEPDLRYELTEKLQNIEKKSTNRKLFLSIFVISLIFIGIVLSIALPIILTKNPSTDNSTVDENPVTISNRMLA